MNRRGFLALIWLPLAVLIGRLLPSPPAEAASILTLTPTGAELRGMLTIRPSAA